MRYVTLVLNCLLAIFCVIAVVMMFSWNRKISYYILVLSGLSPILLMALLGIARYVSKNAVIAITNTVLGCLVLLFGIFLIIIFPIQVEGQNPPKLDTLLGLLFLIATAAANIFGHRRRA